MNEALQILLVVSVFALFLALGALLKLAFRQTVAADWIDGERANLCRIVRLLFYLPLPFAVLYAAGASLFPWARGEFPPGAFAHAYFNPSFVAGRTLAEFALWSTLAWRLVHGHQRTGALPMILILFSVTFAAQDWVLTLEAHGRSTAFGLILLVSGLLASHGLSLSLPNRALSEGQRRDLNTLHFTLIGAWSYLSLMQFIIVWSGNLPTEVTMFTSRLQTSWVAVPWTLLAVQFALPLGILLFRRAKASPTVTRSLGATTFILQLLFIYWLIVPNFHPAGWHFTFTAAAGLVSVMAAWGRFAAESSMSRETPSFAGRQVARGLVLLLAAILLVGAGLRAWVATWPRPLAAERPPSAAGAAQLDFDRGDLRRRAEAREATERQRYEWQDAEHRRARIPVERALTLYLERGAAPP